MDQVKTIYKISQILSKAFKEVNDVCAHHLADRSIQQQKFQQVKVIEKKSKPQKPQQKISPVKEDNSKKQVKKDVKVNFAEKHEQEKQKSRQQESKKVQQKKVEQKPQHNQNSGKSSKVQSHPERPKQPLTAFFLFQKDQKQNVKKMHPTSGITDLAKMMGQIWRGLDASQQLPYIKENQQLKAKYDKQMKKFYEKHPQQKSKKQLKKEKAESKKKQQSAPSSPVPASKSNAPNQSNKPVKKPIVIQEENSESI